MKEAITIQRTQRQQKPYPKLPIPTTQPKIAEKQEFIVSLNTEITTITANIDALKEKKISLKKAVKELTSLEVKKAKADAKAAEKAKKTEAEAVLKKLLASGMSAEEILEKLK